MNPHIANARARGAGGLSEKLTFIYRRIFLLAALACAAGTSAIALAEAPPVVAPPSGEHHVGKIVFLELVTPDIGASKRFYGSLFGWNFEDMQVNGSRYAQASLDGEPVAGLVHR